MVLRLLSLQQTRRALSILVVTLMCWFEASLAARVVVDYTEAVIHNQEGLRLLVAPENTQPTLRIVLPGHPKTDQDIEVVFPEHVTVRKHGSTEAEHIYMFLTYERKRVEQPGTDVPTRGRRVFTCAGWTSGIGSENTDPPRFSRSSVAKSHRAAPRVEIDAVAGSSG